MTGSVEDKFSNGFDVGITKVIAYLQVMQPVRTFDFDARVCLDELISFSAVIEAVSDNRVNRSETSSLIPRVSLL